MLKLKAVLESARWISSCQPVRRIASWPEGYQHQGNYVKNGIRLFKITMAFSLAKAEVCSQPFH